MADVVAAAASRTQQALRSLEEFGGLIGSVDAHRLESLRYAAYDLLASVERRGRVREQLADARLYVLVGGGASADELAEHVRRLCAAGADLIQLRDKRLSDRELLRQGKAAAAAARDAGGLFVMNDRADLALLANADGVHVGQDELTVPDARRIVGGGGLVGQSTHRWSDVEAARAAGADYIGCGPTFPSSTKDFSEFAGLEFLREVVVGRSGLPAFAIGGIDESRLDQVLATGIGRVAVSGAVRMASDPYAIVARLKARLLSATVDRRPPESLPVPVERAAGPLRG
jgi:thiamine-phosphate pyrophosphorylase